MLVQLVFVQETLFVQFVWYFFCLVKKTLFFYRILYSLFDSFIFGREGTLLIWWDLYSFSFPVWHEFGCTVSLVVACLVKKTLFSLDACTIFFWVQKLILAQKTLFCLFVQFV